MVSNQSIKQRSLQLGKNTLALRNQPRIEAFAQGGIGRPNPFNFFETGFQPFLLLGPRAACTPFDWGNRQRDAQKFDLQIKSVETQQQAFEQRLDATTLRDAADIIKWRDATGRDDAIIRLQEDLDRLRTQGMTMLVSTPNMDEAARCDRVSNMVDGKMEALDTPGAMKTQFGAKDMDEVFRKLARGQKGRIIMPR